MILLEVALPQQLMPSNEWISSPAGELWLSELKKARYTRVSNLTDGIRKPRTQEVAESAETPDEKRVEDVMLEVMNSAVPKVH